MYFAILHNVNPRRYFQTNIWFALHVRPPTANDENAFVTNLIISKVSHRSFGRRNIPQRVSNRQISLDCYHFPIYDFVHNFLANDLFAVLEATPYETSSTTMSLQISNVHGHNIGDAKLMAPPSSPVGCWIDGIRPDRTEEGFRLGIPVF